MSKGIRFYRAGPRAPPDRRKALLQSWILVNHGEREGRLLLVSGLFEIERLLQWIARHLGDGSPGIKSVPGVCGGDPVIVRTRIPVWLLEKARREGLTDAAILGAYPTLRAEDLTNAWSFVRVHRDEIDHQILANEAEEAA